MKIRLYRNFYRDQNPERMAELIHVREKNNESGFDYIHEFTGSQPTFNDVFKWMRHFPDDINIVANADILFPQSTLKTIRSWNWKENPKTCFALSRWDSLGQDTPKLFERSDSQDSWILFGPVAEIPGADFSVGGLAGCDNKIAYLLEQAGYTVVNPCKDLITVHYHLSGVRNYVLPDGNVKDRLPPPYKLVQPCYLHEI